MKNVIFVALASARSLRGSRSVVRRRRRKRQARDYGCRQAPAPAPCLGSHICIQSRWRREGGREAVRDVGEGRGDDVRGTDSPPPTPFLPSSPSSPGFLLSCPAPMSPLGFLMDADSEGCLPARDPPPMPCTPARPPLLSVPQP